MKEQWVSDYINTTLSSECRVVTESTDDDNMSTDDELYDDDDSNGLVTKLTLYDLLCTCVV